MFKDYNWTQTYNLWDKDYNRSFFNANHIDIFIKQMT